MRLWFPGVLAVLLVANACDEPTNPRRSIDPPDPTPVRSVSALPQLSLGALVAFATANADLVRVRFKSLDGLDSGVTPWQSAGVTSILVLGLKSSMTYSIQIESSRTGETAEGPPTEFTTSALPPELADVRIQLDGVPSGGYDLANIGAPDGRGFVVAFDSAGTLRWYRDYGDNIVFCARQQQDGHITAFVGPSNGFEALPGIFVEVTAAGDSIRTIAATGSPYTDPHELVTTVDRFGGRVADYLFGYALTEMDRSPQGFNVIENVAYHQVLRISEGGTVDTLINAIDHWTLADAIEPPPIPDLDHPNSLDFDLDGGIVVSYRSLSAIVKVNQATRHIEWQLGGKRNEFTFVNDPLGGFDGQHTVRVLPNGHLLVFDNGWNHSPPMSRAVEYAVDTVAMTASMVWQYEASPPVFNDFTVSAQRLANGNTVVAFTRHGIVDEVRRDGTRLSRGVIELSPGVSAMPYRVIRINNLYGFANP